jgi:hypothetical protein
MVSRGQEWLLAAGHKVAKMLGKIHIRRINLANLFIALPLTAARMPSLAATHCLPLIDCNRREKAGRNSGVVGRNFGNGLD